MMKKAFIILQLILLVFTSCEKEDPIPVQWANKTILVYMVANNNLSYPYNDFDEKDIAEMIEGMQDSKHVGNLILYVDNATSTQLLSIEKDKSGVYQKKLIKEYDDRNSASYSVFSSVLKEVITRYPANSYGLFMWSHGDGWLPSPSKSAQTRWYGQDGNNFMDISEIKKALEEAPHFDFIYFDDCFMQSVEVAYELRRYTDYTMGSVAETPGPGAPYQLLMDLVFQDKADVKTMIERYYNYYTSDEAIIRDNWKYGAAISAIKCDELEGLATETQKIVDKYANELRAINPSTVQNYDPRSQQAYYDFHDVISKVASGEELQTWKQQLDQAVPYKETTPKIYSIYIPGTFTINENYSGISIYMPRPSYTSWNNFYQTFEWGKASGWSKIVNP